MTALLCFASYVIGIIVDRIVIYYIKQNEEGLTFFKKEKLKNEAVAIMQEFFKQGRFEDMIGMELINIQKLDNSDACMLVFKSPHIVGEGKFIYFQALSEQGIPYLKVSVDVWNSDDADNLSNKQLEFRSKIDHPLGE